MSISTYRVNKSSDAMSYFVTSFLNKVSAKFSILGIEAWRLNTFQSCCFSSCLYIPSSTLATVVNLKTDVLGVKSCCSNKGSLMQSFFCQNKKWKAGLKKCFNKFLTVSPGSSGAESEVEFQCRPIAATASTLAAPH